MKCNLISICSLQGLMDQTFHALSSLITTIFREPKTVNLN